MYRVGEIQSVFKTSKQQERKYAIDILTTPFDQTKLYIHTTYASKKGEWDSQKGAKLVSLTLFRISRAYLLK